MDSDDHIEAVLDETTLVAAGSSSMYSTPAPSRSYDSIKKTMDNRQQWNSLFATSFNKTAKRKGKDKMDDESVEKVFVVDDEKVESIFFDDISPFKQKYKMQRSKIVGRSGRPLAKCGFCGTEFGYRYDVNQLITHLAKDNCTGAKDDKDQVIAKLKDLIDRQSQEKEKQAKNEKKQLKLVSDRVMI